MERDLFYSRFIWGKVLWKHFHAGSLFTFDVYKPIMVLLDQQLPLAAWLTLPVALLEVMHLLNASPVIITFIIGNAFVPGRKDVLLS